MKTFLLSIAFASTAMFSGLALATQPGNNGSGNGGCGVGQQTNGCGAQGGAGGNGLGVGVGVGVGIANAAAAANAAAVSGSTSGAAVIGSGNSNVRNTNNNANVQGQQQGQSQSSRNSNRNTAEGGRGGNAAATGGNSGGNTLTGGAVAVSVEGDKGDVVYAPAQERAPVATAYAAPLVSSNGTCMGSSSAGGQGAALGLSFGTTWTDTNCDIRYDAEALRAAGMVDAARARLCQKAEIKDAMAAAGTPCVDKGAQRRAAVTTRDGEGFAAAPQAQYQDPIIRARLNLPPLK